MKSQPSDMPGTEQVLGLHSTEGYRVTLSLIWPAESVSSVSVGLRESASEEMNHL